MISFACFPIDILEDIFNHILISYRMSWRTSMGKWVKSIFSISGNGNTIYQFLCCVKKNLSQKPLIFFRNCKPINERLIFHISKICCWNSHWRKGYLRVHCMLTSPEVLNASPQQSRISRYRWEVHLCIKINVFSCNRNTKWWQNLKCSQWVKLYCIFFSNHRELHGGALINNDISSIGPDS